MGISLVRLLGLGVPLRSDGFDRSEFDGILLCRKNALKATKAELQRRMHDRMAEVGNTTQLRIFKRSVCRLWQSVLVRRSQRAQMSWERFTLVLNRWIPPPAFCTPIWMHASTPLILRKAVCVDALVRIGAGGDQ